MSGYSGAVGTPSYMAPEVALGGDATMASDVFAVGVILHEIFFGRRPEWDTTKRGRFVKPPAVRKGARIERSMARLCLECLEPLAPRRPQTAGEVKKKYERAVLGRYGTFKGAMKAGKWGIVAGAGAGDRGQWDRGLVVAQGEWDREGDPGRGTGGLVAQRKAGHPTRRTDPLHLPVGRWADDRADSGIGSPGSEA